jgi:hypothetical protein
MGLGAGSITTSLPSGTLPGAAQAVRAIASRTNITNTRENLFMGHLSEREVVGLNVIIGQIGLLNILYILIHFWCYN